MKRWTLSILCLFSLLVAVGSFHLRYEPINQRRGIALGDRIASSLSDIFCGYCRLSHSSTRRWMSESINSDAFIQKQRNTSAAITNRNDATFNTESEHLQHQKIVFDHMADTFASGQTISDDLIPVYQHLALSIIGGSASEKRILDVACGAGALWPFFLDVCANGSKVDVIGIDLSENMVAAEGSFHVAVVNACFGNFWTPFEVLSSLTKAVNETVFVSHPLGAEFVAKLHEEDSRTVPHLLPNSILAWQREIARRQIPLRVKNLTLSFGGEPFYLAELQKSRARTLESVVRLSGIVDRGYGRGGKKLGFPTANLPSRLFQGALESVTTGVYFGWAMVQRQVRKAVVNVGYSPTFEGQENPEKIVEAHLITEHEEELGDFYDQPMKLLLLGYLRPEMKFPSFGDLVSQINTDKLDSSEILDDEIYQTFKNDEIFVANDWQGLSGNSENASWDFQRMADML